MRQTFGNCEIYFANEKTDSKHKTHTVIAKHILGKLFIWSLEITTSKALYSRDIIGLSRKVSNE